MCVTPTTFIDDGKSLSHLNLNLSNLAEKMKNRTHQRLESWMGGSRTLMKYFDGWIHDSRATIVDEMSKLKYAWPPPPFNWSRATLTNIACASAVKMVRIHSEVDFISLIELWNRHWLTANCAANVFVNRNWIGDYSRNAKLWIFSLRMDDLPFNVFPIEFDYFIFRNNYDTDSFPIRSSSSHFVVLLLRKGSLRRQRFSSDRLIPIFLILRRHIDRSQQQPAWA